jgi:hypothetical protein
MRDKDKNEPTEFTEEEQKKRDKLLHKLLKTPPQPRPKRKRNKNGEAAPTRNDP